MCVGARVCVRVCACARYRSVKGMCAGVPGTEKLTKRDTETFITYNEEEDRAICFTSNKRLIRTLDKLCENNNAIKRTKTSLYRKTYRFPKEWVSIKFAIEQ